MTAMDPRNEVREFLSSLRARISPEQAGLPAYGGNRRVKGLRREEVAMLAGVSVDYYVRMERGSLAGASESVLDALASALQLDEAEREHLFALARESGAKGSRRRRRTPGTVRPALQQVLDAITDAPAWIRNGRHDVLAMNQLARALYAPVLADPRRPANTARFVYLNREAAEQFFKAQRRFTQKTCRAWDPETDPIRIGWRPRHRRAWGELAKLMKAEIERSGPYSPNDIMDDFLVKNVSAALSDREKWGSILSRCVTVGALYGLLRGLKRPF